MPAVKGELRTDKQFRNGAYGENYMPSTPLLELARFNLIDDVVIGDEFGVLRKLLKGYVDHDMEPTYPGWSVELEKRMSHKLCAIKFPSEVVRTMRSFHYAPCWSGPELHTFLYHASMAVLKDKIEQQAYQHFTLYYCAMTLLSSKAYKKHWQYAGKLLEKFVQQFDGVYKTQLTNTVHNLLHFTPEVIKFGPSTRYAFQSKLQLIRGIAYTVQKPLEKVVRKLVEESALEAVPKNPDDEYDESIQPEYPRIVVSQEEGTVLQVNENFMLQRGVRDGWFLTKENLIVYYTSATVQDGIIMVQGRPMVKQSPAFSYPCSSAIIHNFKASAADLSGNVISVKLHDIKCKLAAAITNKQRTDIYFTPVLQTLGHDTIKLEAYLKSLADEKKKQPHQAAAAPK
ncbi:transposase domain-containing protein [Anopheles sinensis]|uniref:Transposase domain-containing protein n=1 Tax=Anopheles sinensis TaxID=74873 RepID=A0A084VB79_ANOSI|nr:transposase domain-containing protein [Anopheles sinensis]